MQTYIHNLYQPNKCMCEQKLKISTVKHQFAEQRLWIVSYAIKCIYELDWFQSNRLLLTHQANALFIMNRLSWYHCPSDWNENCPFEGREMNDNVSLMKEFFTSALELSSTLCLYVTIICGMITCSIFKLGVLETVCQIISSLIFYRTSYIFYGIMGRVNFSYYETEWQNTEHVSIAVFKRTCSFHLECEIIYLYIYVYLFVSPAYNIQFYCHSACCDTWKIVFLFFF